MKFTIARQDLEFLLKGAGVSRPKAKDTLKLSACAARVFIESKDGIAGIEAVVLADGAVTLPAKTFTSVLKTYKGTKFLNCEGNSDGLQINAFKMPIVSYDPRPIPPGEFKIFSSAAPPDSQSSSQRS